MQQTLFSEDAHQLITIHDRRLRDAILFEVVDRRLNRFIGTQRDQLPLSSAFDKLLNGARGAIGLKTISDIQLSLKTFDK